MIRFYRAKQERRAENERRVPRLQRSGAADSGMRPLKFDVGEFKRRVSTYDAFQCLMMGAGQTGMWVKMIRRGYKNKQCDCLSTQQPLMMSR